MAEHKKLIQTSPSGKYMMRREILKITKPQIMIMIMIYTPIRLEPIELIPYNVESCDLQTSQIVTSH